jgi:hypothetical protein
MAGDLALEICDWRSQIDMRIDRSDVRQANLIGNYPSVNAVCGIARVLLCAEMLC